MKHPAGLFCCGNKNKDTVKGKKKKKLFHQKLITLIKSIFNVKKEIFQFLIIILISSRSSLTTLRYHKSLRKFKLRRALTNKLVYWFTEKGTSQLTRDVRIHGKHTFGIRTEIMYGFNGDLAKRIPQSNRVKCKSYQYLFRMDFRIVSRGLSKECSTLW